MKKLNIPFLTVVIIFAIPVYVWGEETDLVGSKEEIAFKVDSSSEVIYQANAAILFGIGQDVIAGVNSRVSGEIVLSNGGRSPNISGRLVIDAGTFDTENRIRDDHVRDILGADLYPDIVFDLSYIKVSDPLQLETLNGEHTIVGTLQIHGVTKEIGFPIKVSFDGERLVIDGTIKVKFTDFNIEPPKVALIVKQAEDELILKGHIVARKVAKPVQVSVSKE